MLFGRKRCDIGKFGSADDPDAMLIRDVFQRLVAACLTKYCRRSTEPSPWFQAARLVRRGILRTRFRVVAGELSQRSCSYRWRGSAKEVRPPYGPYGDVTSTSRGRSTTSRLYSIERTGLRRRRQKMVDRASLVRLSPEGVVSASSGSIRCVRSFP